MSIHKDNATGKWRVVYRYTDWTGKTKQTSAIFFADNCLSLRRSSTILFCVSVNS